MTFLDTVFCLLVVYTRIILTQFANVVDRFIANKTASGSGLIV